ncbi:MAG: hypothetical protein QM724_13970 [Flavobacteriales bacterium]
MNTNWTKILLFSLLFGAIGFLLGRVCGHGCGDQGCERGKMECHGKGACDKAGCDQQKGAACCKMGGHGMHEAHGEDGLRKDSIAVQEVH